MVHSRDVADYYDKIQKLFNQYRENPRSASTLRELGRIYREIGHYETATFYLEQGLAIDPRDWEGLAILGSVYSESGDYQSALSNYSRAFELGGQLDLLALVGEALYLLGKYDEAEKHLRLTIKLEGSKQLGFSHLMLGKVLSALNRFDEAYFEFKAAEKFKKTNETAKWLKFARTKINIE